MLPSRVLEGFRVSGFWGFGVWVSYRCFLLLRSSSKFNIWVDEGCQN